MAEITHTIAKSSGCHSTSSVLVPDLYLDHYKQRCLALGGRKKYLSHLLTIYTNHLFHYKSVILAGREDRWKTEYQASDQILRKCNFVPIPEDWELLRHLAGSFGVSMCWLFVFMMILEVNGVQPVPAPQNYSKNGNSHPEKVRKSKKFRKFSKFERILDFQKEKLTRKHR